MSIKVCKFGGTSMADGTIIRRAAEIVNADAERRYVVVSAPGKRFGGDIKVTDLLYRCHELASSGTDFGEVFSKIRSRFEGIEKELGKTMEEVFDEVIETPIGSGCIAQVYKAHLRGTNQWVALKVKRPEVDIVFSYDLQLINSVAAFLSIFPFMEYLAPKKAAQLFTSTMHDQLDFRKEAVNLVHFRENFRVCVILNDER